MITSVIHDHDGSIDDLLASMLLAKNPNISLKAVTLACTGEALGLKSAQIAAAILKLSQIEPADIAYSQDKPLSDSFIPFPGWLRNSLDHLLDGTSLNPDQDSPISTDPVAVMKKVLDASSGKVTLVVTGPMTNVANLLQKYPDAKNQIEKIVFMGGAIHVKGNIQDLHNKHLDAQDPYLNNHVVEKDLAECNIAADPYAAQLVFESGVPLVCVPLDATNQVPLTEDYICNLETSSHVDERLVYQMLKKIIDMIPGGLPAFLKIYYLWDPLAAMIAYNPNLAEYTRASLSVDPQTFQIKMDVNVEPSQCNTLVALKIKEPKLILGQLLQDLRYEPPKPMLFSGGSEIPPLAQDLDQMNLSEKGKDSKLRLSQS